MPLAFWKKQCLNKKDSWFQALGLKQHNNIARILNNIASPFDWIINSWGFLFRKHKLNHNEDGFTQKRLIIKTDYHEILLWYQQVILRIFFSQNVQRFRFSAEKKCLLFAVIYEPNFFFIYERGYFLCITFLKKNRVKMFLKCIQILLNK